MVCYSNAGKWDYQESVVNDLDAGTLSDNKGGGHINESLPALMLISNNVQYPLSGTRFARKVRAIRPAKKIQDIPVNTLAMHGKPCYNL